MKERPILFSAPMVNAILDGTKTQTRRTKKLEEINKATSRFTFEGFTEFVGEFCAIFYDKNKQRPQLIKSPYGRVGDQLWVRESFWRWGKLYREENQTGEVSYKWYAEDIIGYVANTPEKPKEKEGYSARKFPSIHMPRWASRIQLEITDIRVERLRDISEEDARTEGLKGITKDGSLVKYGIPDLDGYPGSDDFGWNWEEWQASAINAFKSLWQKINGAESWDKNPWVWIIEFKRITP